MLLHHYIQHPVWIDGTKVKQKIVGFDWTMEVEGELHKKYEPMYETRFPFLGLFGKPYQVEVGKPVPGEMYTVGSTLFYVDANHDWRKITPECKPYFKVNKKGDQNANTE